MLSLYSTKWFIPFTYSIEKIGPANFAKSLTWQNITWLLPNETISNAFNDYI